MLGPLGIDVAVTACLPLPVALAGSSRIPRQLDIIDIGYMMRRKKLNSVRKGDALGKVSTTKEIIENYYAIPSESLNRKPWSVGPPTLTRGSEVYSYCRGTRLCSGTAVSGRQLTISLA